MSTEQFLHSSDVFEITDHTTASDWERFIANLEDVLTEWNLNKQTDVDHRPEELPRGFVSKGIWHEKYDTISYGSMLFDLRYQYIDDSKVTTRREIKKLDPSSEKLTDKNLTASSESLEFSDAKSDEEFTSDHKELSDGRDDIPKASQKDMKEVRLLPECLIDLASSNNDFASKAHCLVRWYNVRKFIVLTLRGDTIVSEDKVRLLLSSASIALANIDCHVPIFIQIHNPKNHFYQGISEHLNIRTMYEMIFLKRSARQYNYLSELINLFREKSGANLGDSISVTIRLNYCLENFELFVTADDEFQGCEHDDEAANLIRMAAKKQVQKGTKKPNLAQDMRSGATYEQVVEAMDDCLPHPYRILKYLHVAALWPPLSDKVITDSPVHSDLDPAEAPIWTIRCVTSDNCNMKIVHETQAVFELLCASLDYAYDKLDASTTFTDTTREDLKSRCLRLCYDLATQPEVLLSERPTDSMRKLIALLFYRAAIIREDMELLNQDSGKPRNAQPSLSEVYRDFVKNKPSVKEFILKANVTRPFGPETSGCLPQRMFCTICEEEFRVCGAFSELCN